MPLIQCLYSFHCPKPEISRKTGDYQNRYRLSNNIENKTRIIFRDYSKLGDKG